MNANTESGRKHEFCSETLHGTVWRKPKLGFCFFCFFFCSRAIQLKVLAEQKVTSQVVITLINNGRMIWAEFNFQCVFRCILAPFCSFRTIGRLILFGLVCLSPFLWYCTGQDSLGITLIRSLLILLPPGQYSICRQYSICKTQRNQGWQIHCCVLSSEKDVRWRWTRKGESSRDRVYCDCYSGSWQYNMRIYQRGAWCTRWFGSVVWIRGKL